MGPATHAYSPLPDTPSRAVGPGRPEPGSHLQSNAEFDLEKSELPALLTASARAEWSSEYQFKGQGSKRRRLLGACLAGLLVLALGGGWVAALREAGASPETGLNSASTEHAMTGLKQPAAAVGPIPPSPLRVPTSAQEVAHESECSIQSVPVRPTNVDPNPRPPPPCASATERFLSYEAHSGFHNQASALLNALILAKSLNRTLLLPPARVGMATPWGPSSRNSVPFQEDCKAERFAGREFSPKDKCMDPSGKGRFSPDHFTYVGWDLVMEPAFLASHGVELVDRWNSSQAWLELPRSEGGLGVRPEETWTFDDEDRRSYQLYDSDESPDAMGDTWSSRINLDELRVAPMADKKLIKFGSLFGYGRLHLTLEETKHLHNRVVDSMILSESVLDGISGEIKQRLGTYVGVHLRIGDGVFAKTASDTFPEIFRELAEDVLGVKSKHVDKLLAKSAKAALKMDREQEQRPRLLARAFASDEEEDDANEAARFTRRSTSDEPWWPVPPSSRQPLTANMTCRGKLHPSNSPLAALNTPIFVATDAHHPSAMSPFLPFFDHLPCLFTLDDFASPSKLNGHAPIPALTSMAAGERMSDWDGRPVDHFLFGFLDAIVAAKGDEMIGTPRSTFSSYTQKTLHPHFVEEWEEAGRAKAVGGLRR